jgi:hypothetical protein
MARSMPPLGAPQIARFAIAGPNVRPEREAIAAPDVDHGRQAGDLDRREAGVTTPEIIASQSRQTAVLQIVNDDGGKEIRNFPEASCLSVNDCERGRQAQGKAASTQPMSCSRRDPPHREGSMARARPRGDRHGLSKARRAGGGCLHRRRRGTGAYAKADKGSRARSNGRARPARSLSGKTRAFRVPGAFAPGRRFVPVRIHSRRVRRPTIPERYR